MRAFLSILASILVVGLGFWAYRENYATQTAIDEVERLGHELAETRAALSVLRAEWAYLNRPDRLRDLVDLNFDRLGLMPLMPEQFAGVDEVTYPPAVWLPSLSDDPVDVANGRDGLE